MVRRSDDYAITWSTVINSEFLHLFQDNRGNPLNHHVYFRLRRRLIKLANCYL